MDPKNINAQITKQKNWFPLRRTSLLSPSFKFENPALQKADIEWKAEKINLSDSVVNREEGTVT